jgi:hypothetical protein
MPAEYFDVQVPAGLADFHVRAPNFVDVAGMSAASRAGSSARVGAGGQLAIVNGLVTNDLQVRFENFARQWRFTPQGGPTSRQGPGQFQFLGGNVLLVQSLGIYILNTNEPNPSDQLSVGIFSAVYSHELLHVLDEIDIVRNWLPPRLNTEPTIARYLVQAQTYAYGTASQTIVQVEREFQTYMQNTLQTAVHNIWAVEANRRQALRDAPAEYRIVQERVDQLRTRQINR